MRAYSRFSKLFQFSFWERVPEAVEVDPVARDDDAFRAQPQTLLESVLAGEPDFSAGADDAVPWNMSAVSKRPDDLPRRAGMSAGSCDVTVSRYPAFRDFGDGGQNLLEHGSVLPGDLVRVIDHDCVERPVSRFELQPELFLHGGEERRRSGIVGRAGRTAARRPMQLDLIFADEASQIHDDLVLHSRV